MRSVAKFFEDHRNVEIVIAADDGVVVRIRDRRWFSTMISSNVIGIRPFGARYNKKLPRRQIRIDIFASHSIPSSQIVTYTQILFSHLLTIPHTHINMSGNSNVGTSAVYEAGDQRTYKDSELQQAKAENRFHEGKPNSHLAQDSSKLFLFSKDKPHVVSTRSV